MKHISEVIAERHASLFDISEEKGSGEWQTFNAVQDDALGAYRVALPRRAVVLREPHHVLRIVYPQPHNLYLRGAH